MLFKRSEDYFLKNLLTDGLSFFLNTLCYFIFFIQAILFKKIIISDTRICSSNMYFSDIIGIYL